MQRSRDRVRIERKKSMREEAEAEGEAEGEKGEVGKEESVRKASSSSSSFPEGQTRRGSMGTQAEELLDEADREIQALHGYEEGEATAAGGSG